MVPVKPHPEERAFCALAENTLNPRVHGDGSVRDPRSYGILEADFLDPALRQAGKDTKFVREVSQIIDTFADAVHTHWYLGFPGENPSWSHL